MKLRNCEGYSGSSIYYYLFMSISRGSVDIVQRKSIAFSNANREFMNFGIWCLQIAMERSAVSVRYIRANRRLKKVTIRVEIQ